MRPPQSLIRKDLQACTKHSGKLWSCYKTTAMHRRFPLQQWCHFTAYDSAISSFKIRPISVHGWNFVQCRIYPILDLRALLNSRDCWNLRNSHVMIGNFCNHHATSVTILRHRAISSKLSPRSKNANRKKR